MHHVFGGWYRSLSLQTDTSTRIIQNRLPYNAPTMTNNHKVGRLSQFDQTIPKHANCLLNPISMYHIYDSGVGGRLLHHCKLHKHDCGTFEVEFDIDPFIIDHPIQFPVEDVAKKVIELALDPNVGFSNEYDDYDECDEYCEQALSSSPYLVDVAIRDDNLVAILRNQLR